MRTLLIAAVLVAGPVAARPPPAAGKSVAQAPATTTSKPAASDDDDDEDEAKPPTTSVPSPDSTVAPAPTGPAAAAPTADPKAQQLVSGAPLYNPNVAVHIVEKKQFADRGKHEIVLYPAWVQVNGKFTQHVGTAMSYVYHLQENFGLQLTPLYNWIATESAFNGELVRKVNIEAQFATSLLLKWALVGGVEATPIYGKFAFYEGAMAHFAFVINAGAGIGSTLHQLKPDTDTPATFGDTGYKFTGSIGLGGRVQLGDRFAIRLELRDLVYTARVDTVNGCNAADMKLLRDALGASSNKKTFDDVPTRDSCQKSRFNGNEVDIPLARRVVDENSSDVLNNVGFYAGFSVLF